MASQDATAEHVSCGLLKQLDDFESWRPSQKRRLMECLVKSIVVNSKTDAKVLFTLPLTRLPNEKPGPQGVPVPDEKPHLGVPLELLASNGLSYPSDTKWLRA